LDSLRAWETLSARLTVNAVSTVAPGLTGRSAVSSLALSADSAVCSVLTVEPGTAGLALVALVPAVALRPAVAVSAVLTVPAVQAGLALVPGQPARAWRPGGSTRTRRPRHPARAGLYNPGLTAVRNRRHYLFRN